MGWKAATVPWESLAAPPDRWAGGRFEWATVAVGLLFFAVLGLAAVGVRPAARLIEGCSSRSAGVSQAAASLGLSQVAHVTYLPADDGDWVATFGAIRDGAVVHGRTDLTYSHRWFGNCYTTVGSMVE